MRVLIAPDKFKGTLSAADAARAMTAGVRDAAAIAQISPAIQCRPLADGGEGSHDCLHELKGGGENPELRECIADLADANGCAAPVKFLESVEPGPRNPKHYYLETALAIGLTLPGARDRSILDRTTRGVGDWIKTAITGSANLPVGLHLFLGGSATSDGGFGLARALGFRFRATDGTVIDRFREVLAAREVIAPQEPRASREPITIHVYTDVQNPLDGPTGAARLFGPQKGATANEVEELEQCLRHLGAIFEISFGTSVETTQPDASTPRYRRPGAGAAGGLALPLLYWPGVRVEFRSGIDFFLEAARIAETIRDEHPDCIITGEGATDRGSLQGKVVAGLGRLCKSLDKKKAPPLLIVSGTIPETERDDLVAAGFTRLYDTNQVCGERWPLTPDQAAERLRRTTAFAVRGFFPDT